MNFRKVNNLTGWAVFLAALVTYVLTREARGSLWDTGEFIASAQKLQLPHPPGAPVFVLLGRFFIILFGDNGQTAGSAVNFMSALASAATILFLFWSITHFARKMFVGVGEALTSQQLFTTMAAGLVGALAYTFSDSFWYSAVEGEVYALSSFFTAIVFWAMLKWEHADEHAGMDAYARARSDRWIVFLFFMIGLSIGVHLLNLLTIPAIVMIYYYRRYRTTTKGAILAFLVGCIITGIVQVAIIQYSMKAAGMFDVFFVNSFKMPFFSGFTIYFIALAAVIGWALTFTERNISKNKLIIWFVLFLGLSTLPFFMSVGSGGEKFAKFLLIAGIAAAFGYFLKPAALKVLKLAMWSYAFIMLGYFVYFTALIRSNADPAIDMNNVDNPINLVYYLSREQYGSAPLVYGPHYAAEVARDDNGYAKVIEGEMKFVKGKDSYIPVGPAREYDYESSDKQLFPRIWDSSNDQNHAYFYAQWLGLSQSQDPQTGQVKYEAPSYADNLEWFFTYQTGLMYWRYFMWNFAGKQNDVQGMGSVRDGNWISGIPFIDNTRLGDQSKLPESVQNNKAHNKLFMLPFLLGIIGCVYQYMKNRKDWIVSFLLFFFTGIAVVLYLNQPGNQPRERDYAFVGSFYAFAFWIGLAVVAFVKMARDKADKQGFKNILTYGSALTFIIILMSSLRGSLSSMLMTCLYITALFAVITIGITYLVRALSSGGTNWKMLNISTALICLIVPAIMLQQEWDDHDRSNKTLAPDLARNYLESCAPNAILFTFGDNDTYPLWYAQEVEGIRPDIRIINNSLLGIDWYINQLRRKINQADSVDVIWSEEQIEGHNREYVRYKPKGDQTTFYDLYSIMKQELGKPAIDPETGRDVGAGTFPVSRIGIPVDVAAVRANKTVNPEDSIVSPMVFEIPQGKLNGLTRSDLMVLNIIAANKWRRPIYFTNAYGELGFGQYIRKDGLSYRLVPIRTNYPQANWVIEQTINRLEQQYRTSLGGTQIRDNNETAIYDNLMNKFAFGGADKKGVYFDEENRRHLLNIRAVYGEAAGNLADNGKKEEAQKLLDKAESGINAGNLPYGMVSRFNSHNQTGLLYLEAAYKSGKTDLAEKVRLVMRKDLEQQKKYYEYLKNNRPELFGGTLEGTEVFLNDVMLEVLKAIEEKYSPQSQTQAPAEVGGTIINTPKDSTTK
ncbi:MAG: glycosyltransferase family 117 protein [Chitinophagaceae bacterium]